MSEQAAWGDEIVQLAELFHNIYEEEARRFGWKSQTPVPFGELPEANAQTMLCTVARVRREVCADLVRVTAERDEAREMLRGIRECIDLFQHDTMFDLKGHLLAILKGDTE